MTCANEKLTRRAALRRLGLAVGAAYCSPMLTGMSSAQAASSASSTTNPTPPSDPTAPTAPSTPSAVSSPSSPSGAENQGGPGDDGRDDGPNGSQGECSGPSGSERIEISRRDMDLANDAVARGEARPLREILPIVQRRHPGRMIRVGFNPNGGARQYWLRIVTQSGSVQTVTVDALTGATVYVRGC